MRRLALALTLLVLCCTAALAAPGLTWQTDYRAAQTRAQKSNRRVFIDFYADWCGPCREMTRTTFRDAAVIRALQQMECVRINVDEGSPLVAQYSVSGIPRLLVLSPQGDTLVDMVGYRDAKELLAEISAAPTRPNARGARPTPHDAPPAPAKPADPVLALGAPDRQVREEAARLLQQKGPAVVPRLLTALDHPQLGVRIGASHVLTEVAHPPKTLRYDPWAPKPRRQEAARALRAWWQQRSSAKG